MKIVHISTSNQGGAGIAALRLHERLLKIGVDSTFLSLHRFPSPVAGQLQFRKRDYSSFPLLTDIAQFARRILRKFGLEQSKHSALEAKHLKGRPNGFEMFSLPFSGYRIDEHPLVKQADIVHLHWVSDGFLDYKSFFSATDKKVVWTLHDMFAFTGGCHHSDGCTGFMAHCDACPQLKGTIDEQYAGHIIDVKESGLSRMNDRSMQVVCPSSWLKQLSEQSRLFKRFGHTVIANVLNETRFGLRDKYAARKKLSIPEEKKVILIVAHSLANVRKGGKLLLDALEHLRNDSEVLLCSVGFDAETVNYPVPHLSMGYVNAEDRMADIYAAVDVFVLPSMAENFPNTICESLLCGTPVVAFNVGGIPELVNNSNGRLAVPYDTKQLAESIRFVLQHPEDFPRAEISTRAHGQLNSETSTNSYLAVYRDLLKSNA